jgi:hypothetical protein
VSSLKRLTSRKGEIKEVKEARKRANVNSANTSGLKDPKTLKKKNLSRKQSCNKEIHKNSDSSK